MKVLRSLCSCTALGVVAVLGYLLVVGFELYKATHPLYGVATDPSEPTVDPLWTSEDSMDLWCFLAPTRQFRQIDLKSPDKEWTLLLHETNITLGNFSVPHVRHIRLGSNLPRSMWSVLRSNQTTAFMHVFARRNNPTMTAASNGADTLVTAAMLKTKDWLRGVVQMTKVDEIPMKARDRFLWHDLLWLLPASFRERFWAEVTAAPEYTALPKGSKITFWKPELAIRLVLDEAKYPASALPRVLNSHLVAEKRKLPADERAIRTRQGEVVVGYKAPFYADEMSLTTDKYIPLNSTASDLPLKVTISSMSLQRWLLMAHMEMGLQQQRQSLGFSNRDIDDVRRLIADTNPVLLGVTIVASTLHLLFEFLAFHSDVNFWKNNKSLQGLSTRAVIIEMFFQVVIFLYLLDEDTSMLVVIPAAIGIVIQAWKVWRATGLTISWTNTRVPRLKFMRWEAESTNGTSELAKLTLEVDRKVVIHLSIMFLPLCLGFALRSFVHEKHTSWYSWTIGSLTSCVYAFGFVLMTPQLFINHKLRSVAHLPWKHLCFRFVNTFIDDLFAFIIKMPTMHRLSVFRDDFVFLVYLYQRWTYPVDDTRPLEMS